MFGPQGTVNELLKDGDEDELEDKACRMKIAFLKGGVQFPFYLRLVTGGRKRLAPTVVISDGEDVTDTVQKGMVSSVVALRSPRTKKLRA